MNVIELTPTSSCAVPVTVNVVVGMTLPDGPLTEVVGVSSARPNVSNFLMAFDGVAAAVDREGLRQRRESAVARDRQRQRPVAVDVAFGVARVALIVFAATPRGQVVLEVLAAVAVAHLELDTLDAAGRGGRAVDDELRVGRLDPTLDRG